jgi:cell shape-determining protein MreC
VLPINDMGTTTIFDRKKTIILNSLAQDYSRLYATVLFNKGFKDGVKEGDYVFLRGRNIMCSITEVYAQSSACSLFTAYGRSIEGVTASSSVVLTLTGRGGHYLASVVRDTPVIVGEKVYFKENQSFVLGKVVDIINNNQDTSWHVFIEAEYNPSVSSIFYIEPDLQLQ